MIGDLSQRQNAIFALLTEARDLSDDERGSIDDIIRRLEALKHKEYKYLPGGINYGQHFLKKIGDNIKSMEKGIQRGPTPEDRARQKAFEKEQLQARKGQHAEAVQDINEPKLFSSVSRNEVSFINPTGISVDVSGAILNEYEREYLKRFIRDANYDPLLNRIKWMKSLGFWPMRHLELDRWVYKSPTKLFNIKGSSVAYDGDTIRRGGGEDSIFAYGSSTSDNFSLLLPVPDSIPREFFLEEWSEKAIEELIASIAPVLICLKQVGGKLTGVSLLGGKLIN